VRIDVNVDDVSARFVLEPQTRGPLGAGLRRLRRTCRQWAEHVWPQSDRLAHDASTNAHLQGRATISHAAAPVLHGRSRTVSLPGRARPV
jgi:hypothetical protein